MEHYTVSLARFVVWLRVEAALSAVAALALIVGGSMLITRNQVGRTLVVLGCLVVVAHASVGWVAAAQMNHWFTVMGVGEEGLRWFDTPNRTSIVLMSVALPVITGISLLHPAVRRRFDLPETAETAL
jgi:glucose dehydrogenase